MKPTEQELKLGDIVLVDKDFANGGYEAEIIWLAEFVGEKKKKVTNNLELSNI